MDKETFQASLDKALKNSLENRDGFVVSYIPELANVDPELTSVSIKLTNGDEIHSDQAESNIFTLQSTAKLVPLIGLLEEAGEEDVLKWINVEPSGQSYASLARIDDLSSAPSNPMVNAGAIALCDHLIGNLDSHLSWIASWMEKLFGEKLNLNLSVFDSECRTGDRNRALAYLMKSTGVIQGDVEEVLKTYFALCSYEANVTQASHLPMLLANRGVDNKGNRIISERTSECVLSIMATCGLYDESGIHLWKTGLPSKSGVSGIILASAPGIAGIAAYSPRINEKGTSIRASMILESLSKDLGIHFGSHRCS